MDIDFPLLLVVATLVTGVIWLVDGLLWQRARQLHNEAAAEGDDIIKESWLVETSRSFFPVLLIVLVLRSFLVEPFQIPSGSMLPTLEVGDFILVNKFSYGVRLPVVGTKVLAVGDPQRGDIMVFKYPVDRKTNYIKRVVGLPGDVVRYRNKQLYINGSLVPETHVATLPSFKLLEEQLGQVKHKIYEKQGSFNLESEGEWRVPERSYFMMGDNRDNSSDGRFWGFVPDELVVGKAFAIWMHWEKLLSIPSFSRVGLVE